MYVPFDKEAILPTETINNICLIRSKEKPSDKALKLAGYYTWITYSELSFENWVNDIIKFRSRAGITFTVPVFELNRLHDSSDQIPAQIGMHLRIFPGHEKRVISAFQNLIMSCLVNTNELPMVNFALINGQFDAALRNPVNVYLKKLLHEAWSCRELSHLHSSHTFFILKNGFRQDHISQENTSEQAYYPEKPDLIKSLVEGFDCTRLKEEITKYIDHLLPITANTSGDVRPEIHPLIQPGYGPPNARFSNNDNHIIFIDFKIGYFKNKSHNHITNILAHEIRVATAALIIENVNAIKKIKERLQKTNHEDLLLEPRLSISEAAATAVAISSCSRNNTVSEEEIKQYCVTIFGRTSNLGYKLLSRFILAVAIRDAVCLRVPAGTGLFGILIEAERKVYEALFDLEPPARSRFVYLQKHYFFGNIDLWIRQSTETEASFMAALFTMNWGMALDFVSLLVLGEESPKSASSGDFPRILAWNHSEVHNIINSIVTPSDNTVLTLAISQLAQKLTDTNGEALNDNIRRATAIREFQKHFLKEKQWPRLTSTSSSFYNLDRSKVGFEKLFMARWQKNSIRFPSYLRTEVADGAMRNGFERPEDYSSSEFLRRIKLEIDSLVSIRKSLGPKDLNGLIVSANLSPWLMFPADPIDNAAKKYNNGNPYYEEYNVLLKNTVTSFIRRVRELNGRPFLEITEGDLFKDRESKKWDSFWATLKDIKSSVNILGIGLDDQFANGTDLNKLKTMIDQAVLHDFRYIMIKIDGTAIKSLLPTLSADAKNKVSVNDIREKASIFEHMIGLLTSTVQDWSPIEVLYLVFEGYDGYFKPEEQGKYQPKHRRMYQQLLREALSRKGMTNDKVIVLMQGR